MDEPTTTEHPNSTSDRRRRAGRPVAEDVLVEEVSIDGMCGVY